MYPPKPNPYNIATIHNVWKSDDNVDNINIEIETSTTQPCGIEMEYKEREKNMEFMRHLRTVLFFG